MSQISRVLLLIAPLFTLSTGTVLAQQPDKQTLFGKIESSEDKSPVGFATVYNKVSKQLVYSDSIGFFNIEIKNGDTLFFSRIGFFNREIPVKELLLNTKKLHIISMDARTYDLAEVTIPNFGTYEEFKYKVINSPLPKSDYVINPALYNGLNQAPVILQEQASISLGSPVTAIYMLLSKEGKSLRKLDKLKAQEREVESYIDKYNSSIVSQLTGLKELELEKFMKYCNPDVNFLKNSTDYDIAAKILECLKNFNAEKAANPNKTDQ